MIYIYMIYIPLRLLPLGRHIYISCCYRGSYVGEAFFDETAHECGKKLLTEWSNKQKEKARAVKASYARDKQHRKMVHRLEALQAVSMYREAHITRISTCLCMYTYIYDDDRSVMLKSSIGSSKR